MLANYIPPITDKPIQIQHLVTLYRKQITSTHTTEANDLVNNYWSFIFVESGTALITVGEKSYVTESGNIIFIAPNQFHIVRSADASSVSYIYASFVFKSANAENFKNLPIRCNASDYNYLLVALDNATAALSMLVDTVSNQYPHLKDIYHNRCNEYLQIAYNSIELFLLIISGNKPSDTPAKDTHKQTRHANITAGVEAYLAEHIRDSISLQETAQHFGYSVSNIQKIFKAVTGQSIIVYFNKLKLDEAKILIAENNMTFSQIASYLGYSNPNYFSRIFKATVGMTPTEYANLNQKEHSDINAKALKTKSKPLSRAPRRASKKNT